MAYRLKLDERPGQTLRRISREQLTRFEQCLTRNPDPAAAVHEARKALKRLRSLLRLLRPGLQRGVFERENKRLAAVGQRLSPARDHDVLIAMVTCLAAPPYALTATEIAAIREAADGARPSAAVRVSTVTRKAARKQLGAALQGLMEAAVEPDDVATLFDGLEEGYRRCRRSFERAYAESSDGAFHNWRKDVQRHWRHTALLTRAWPEDAKARIVLGRDIAERLGQDQDLGLLQNFLRSTSAERLDPPLRKKVLEKTTLQRNAIRSMVEPLGKRLLAERPGAHRRRVQACWEAAQLQKERKKND